MMTNDAGHGTVEGLDVLLQPWQRLAIQLSPLIGDSGFCALYSRSARLAAGRFGWLLPVPSVPSIQAVLLALRTLFSAAGAVEAAAANDAMLHTFTKLLAGLIGEALTRQLLDAAPADVSVTPVQEQK